jgi:hypothetical protein
MQTILKTWLTMFDSALRQAWLDCRLKTIPPAAKNRSMISILPLSGSKPRARQSMLPQWLALQAVLQAIGRPRRERRHLACVLSEAKDPAVRRLLAAPLVRRGDKKKEPQRAQSTQRRSLRVQPGSFYSHLILCVLCALCGSFFCGVSTPSLYEIDTLRCVQDDSEPQSMIAACTMVRNWLRSMMRSKSLT